MSQVSICDKDFDISFIKTQLFIDRINTELSDSSDVDKDRADYLKHIVDSLNNNSSSINDIFDKVSQSEFNRKWCKLSPASKLIKLNEFINDKNLSYDDKKLLLDALDHKKLMSKCVNYDNEHMKIISITLNKRQF